jgi:hypothetical protein
MHKSWKFLLLAGLALTLPASAGTGGHPGTGLEGCALSGQVQTIDPYARFLPADINTTSFELSNSYSIELKPLRADDMSQYQFKTVDNRGLGAGYASPYLWEVGRGPGSSMMSTGSWNTRMDGRSYSPIPMPGR